MRVSAGSLYPRRGSPFWRMKFYLKGKPVRETTEERKEQVSGMRKCMRAGVRPGLQILWACLWWAGRFDSDTLPPQKAATIGE